MFWMWEALGLTIETGALVTYADISRKKTVPTACVGNAVNKLVANPAVGMGYAKVKGAWQLAQDQNAQTINYAADAAKAAAKSIVSFTAKSSVADAIVQKETRSA